MSDENIAEMKYKDNNAVLHFKQPGDVQLYFIADNDIKSDTVTITVTNKVAEKNIEKKRIKEEQEAAAKAEAENQEHLKIAAKYLQFTLTI